jgi:hypothetical protein
VSELDEARIFLEGSCPAWPRGVVVLHAELPVASVRDIVQQCLTSGRRTGPFAVAAINRIGRSSTCMMTCSPLKDKGDGGGAVLLMEEAYRG